jgi:hypothetical protein
MTSTVIDFVTAGDSLTERMVSTRSRGRTLADPTTLTGRRRVARLDFEQGTIVVEYPDNEPAWMWRALTALQRILALENDWDSYGARPIQARAAVTALRVLVLIMQDTSLAPTVVPTSPGGIQLEWHGTGTDLEINVSPDGEAWASFSSTPTDEEWEQEAVDDIGRLADAVRRFAPGH